MVVNRIALLSSLPVLERFHFRCFIIIIYILDYNTVLSPCRL